MLGKQTACVVGIHSWAHTALNVSKWAVYMMPILKIVDVKIACLSDLDKSTWF